MHVFLETERLILRRFTAGDVDNLVGLDADPDVMRFVSGGTPTSRDAIENEFLPAFLGYYQRYQAFGFWAAIEKPTGDFLGWFHFRPRHGSAPDQVELGYRMRKSAWGKGYATEGSRALIRKGFTESGVQCVTAEAMAANIASRRVMEKAGLSLVRTFTQPGPDATGGHLIEVVEYALNKADWEKRIGIVNRGHHGSLCVSAETLAAHDPANQSAKATAHHARPMRHGRAFPRKRFVKACTSRFRET